MAIPFTNPILNLLPDQGTYDPIEFIDIASTGRSPITERLAEYGQTTMGFRIPTEMTFDSGSELGADFPGVNFEPKPEPEPEPDLIIPPSSNFTGFSGGDDDRDGGMKDAQAALTAEKRQSAFEVLKERFTSFGLTGLANEIEKIFKGESKTKAGSAIPIPTSESGFYLALIETQAYYDRFGKVNEARVKNGYTALDERTILGMEDEYQKTMKAYNMPKGFYDTPEDFQVFLANDKSELEIADTLQASRQVSMATDPVIKDQLKTLYNIDDNMLTAYIADPEKGQALLNQLAGRSLTAASALLSGLTAQAAEIATGYGAGEMRFGEQMQRFGAAQPIAERGQFLSQIERAEKEFGEKEAVDITFGGLEQSRQAAEKLASRERARFGGAAGTTTASFGRSSAGQI